MILLMFSLCFLAFSTVFLPRYRLTVVLVAVANVVPSKTVVCQNYSILINVTIENQGDFPETFGIIAPYYEGVVIPTPEQWRTFWSMGDVNVDGYIDQTDMDIIGENWAWQGPPGENPADINSDGAVNLQDAGICAYNEGLDIWTHFGLPQPPKGTQKGVRLYYSCIQATLIFTWNTTGFAKGNYTITAYADPVSGETDTADNNFTDGWVIVAMAGDITGPEAWPDGKWDIRDIALVAKHFGQNVPLAPPNCDSCMHAMHEVI